MLRCARCGKRIDPDRDQWRVALRLQCEKCDRWFSPAFHVACLTVNPMTSHAPANAPELGDGE
jgi:hypothetical protein